MLAILLTQCKACCRAQPKTALDQEGRSTSTALAAADVVALVCMRLADCDYLKIRVYGVLGDSFGVVKVA